MSRVYDMCEKLVGAVLKREELRRIAPCESFTSSISTDFSSRFSFGSDLHDVPADGNTSSRGRFDPADPSSHSPMAIKFEEIKKATNYFQPETLLGEGRFGCVFKGWIDEYSLTAVEPGSGTAVAIKIPDIEGYWRGYKESFYQLFQKELKYVSELCHPNLVKLIGYCFEKDHRLLVYEFMSRGSLDVHLFTGGHRSLSWAARIKVAIGAARGLAFLHDLAIPITYHGFNTGDILLDDEFNAKLSGFGFAREGPIGNMPDKSRQIFSVLGFVAPEYLTTGLPTRKCDVFRFGVVLLELLSGLPLEDLAKQNNVDWTKSCSYGKNILFQIMAKQKQVDWAKPCSIGKAMLRIMDSRLHGQYSKKEAYKVATLVSQCLSPSRKERPTIDEVVVALEQCHE